MSRIQLHVNGKALSVEIEPRTHLADFLPGRGDVGPVAAPQRRRA